MEYRTLGNTGMKLSSLSFGASSLGGVFHNFSENDGIRAVHAALDHGINFIDVSPYYGFTRAESVLGKAICTRRRDSFYLSTKVGRYGENGVKTWDYSAARAIKSVEESMRRLQTDYIDLINVHDIEFSNIREVIDETIPALLRLREQGKTGHVGITGLPLNKLHDVTAHFPSGTVESILSFCHYTLQDDSLADELPFYHQRGTGVINASPLSMGLLSTRGTPDWHPASARLKAACTEAAEYCRHHNFPIEQLAIAFSTAHPHIATTLVSTTSQENIMQNIRWAESAIPAELLAEVMQILKPVHRETWENS